MKIPAKIKPAAIVALIDTREQRPLTLPGLQTEPATLVTGDYSVKGLEHHIAIERKSLSDLLACCGRERERFDREVQRLLAYPVRCLVVEADWADIETGDWRSRLTPKQVGASLVSWQCKGLPVQLAGNHQRAGKLVASILHRATVHEYRKLRTLAKAID